MTAASINDILPVAPLQEDLLCHDQFDRRAGYADTVPLAVDLHGETDGDGLRGAIKIHRCCHLGRHDEESMT